MKIAFSTLGCPDFSWPDIYAMAKDLGFDGIEIRGLGNEIFAVKAQPFTESELPQTIQKLSELHLEIPCLSSGCCLKYADKAEENYHEIVEYNQTAGKLGTRMSGFWRTMRRSPRVKWMIMVLSVLRRLIPVAEEHGVTLLVETNGFMPIPPGSALFWMRLPVTRWQPLGCPPSFPLCWGDAGENCPESGGIYQICSY